MRSRRVEVVVVQLVGLIGVAALLEGARRIYVPAAFLLAGLLFVVFAVLKSAQLAGRPAPERSPDSGRPR